MMGQAERAPTARLSEWIADSLGLHFPPERREDLERGLSGAARDLGFEDGEILAEHLLAQGLDRDQLLVLASHLTIGETYFFRDPPILEALTNDVLPALIRARRAERRLRIWSAACCTGEEPYSLAILLDQCFPEVRDWHVTITATDINPRFLQKGRAGLYGAWSFRNAPPGLQERYFHRTPEGPFALRPELRARVNFANLNLVEDVYPSLPTDTHAMDLIICRHVLMYFTAAQTARVIAKLHRALAEGGWLVVGPSEATSTLFPQFERVAFPGSILFRKAPAKPQPEIPEPAPFPPAFAAEALPTVTLGETPTAAREPPPEGAGDPGPEAAGEALAQARTLYQQGCYGAVAELAARGLTSHALGPEGFSLLVRALANQGRLVEALAGCDQWITADKLDPLARYLRATVLVELGEPVRARAALQQAIYLQADFALAHFVLANLARGLGKAAEAERHFAITRALLQGRAPDDLLPESEGLTVGRLSELLAALIHREPGP